MRRPGRADRPGAVPMSRPSRRHLVAGALAGATASFTLAAGASAETWTFDLETTGNDVSYVSPTSVDPSAPLYAYSFVVSTIEVDVSYLIFDFTVDVTEDVPLEDRSGAGTVAGPAPITFFNGTVVFPEPPEPPSVAATLDFGLNAGGFGFANATNVTLGEAQVDLGDPFGVVTVDIEAIRLGGEITIDPVVPGDVTGDGLVDFSDVLALLTAWGPCPAKGACPADLNLDGQVGFSDLLTVLTNYEA